MNHTNLLTQSKAKKERRVPYIFVDNWDGLQYISFSSKNVLHL